MLCELQKYLRRLVEEGRISRFLLFESSGKFKGLIVKLFFIQKIVLNIGGNLLLMWVPGLAVITWPPGLVLNVSKRVE